MEGRDHRSVRLRRPDHCSVCQITVEKIALDSKNLRKFEKLGITNSDDIDQIFGKKIINFQGNDGVHNMGFFPQLKSPCRCVELK